MRCRLGLVAVGWLCGCDVTEQEKGTDTAVPTDWTTSSSPSPTGTSSTIPTTTNTGTTATSTTTSTTGGTTPVDTATATSTTGTTTPPILDTGLDTASSTFLPGGDSGGVEDSGLADSGTAATTSTTLVWGTTGTSTSVGTGTGTGTVTFTFTSVPGGPSTVGPPVGTTTTTTTTTSTVPVPVPLAADWEEACTEHIVDGIETCFAFIPETSADGRTFAVIHYLSTVPMYGYQFDLVDGTYNGTTAEVAGGFWALAMETTLLGVSLTLDSIEPGTGVLLEAGFEEVSTRTRITPLIVGDGPDYLEASSVVLGGGLLWD